MGHQREDMLDSLYRRMFFNVDKKINNKIVKTNIIEDDFNDFNKKIQDRIIREIYDKDCINKNPIQNLVIEKNKNSEIKSLKIKERNLNYNDKINSHRVNM